MKTQSLFVRILNLLFFGLFLLHGGTVGAQTYSFGIKAGLSIPQLQGGNDEQSKGYKSRLGPNFGLFGTLDFSSDFALQVEANYASQGGKKSGLQAIDASNLQGLPIPSGMTIYANFKNEAIMNYLEVPLLVKYKLALPRNNKFYIDAGPYIGFLLNAKTKAKGVSQIFLDKNGTVLTDQNGNAIPAQDFSSTTDISNDLKTINLGFSGGIGLTTPLGKGDLVLDLRGTYGLTNIQKDSANGKNNTGSLVITFGYSFMLGNAHR